MGAPVGHRWPLARSSGWIVAGAGRTPRCRRHSCPGRRDRTTPREGPAVARARVGSPPAPRRPCRSRIYRWSQLELAQQYLSALPEAQQLSACPIVGLSTRDEARNVAACLKTMGEDGSRVQRVLLVTSDFHTRRALAIFRHEIPTVQFSAAAAYDPAQYGARWWHHRQWAKTFFDECVRLVWWYAVDRWRK